MTVKEFFKSTAFKSLAVLLAIVIVAGALLAIFHDLLFVSAEERLARALNKIYGEEVEYETELGTEDSPIAYDGGQVNQAYLITSDGNYLIQSTGTGGFSGGTITVWTIFSCNGSKAQGNLEWTGIERIIYESNEGQTYIGRFTASDYAQFSEHNDELLEGLLFGDDITVIKTGSSAPLTFGALTNAVNCAVTYFKREILGEAEEIKPEDYSSYIILDQSEITPDSETDTVTYSLTVKAPANYIDNFEIEITVTDGAITKYAIVANGSTHGYESSMHESVKDGSLFIGKTATDITDMINGDYVFEEKNPLKTGATFSTLACLRAAAFATVNYERYLQGGTV